MLCLSFIILGMLLQRPIYQYMPGNENCYRKFCGEKFDKKISKIIKMVAYTAMQWEISGNFNNTVCLF